MSHHLLSIVRVFCPFSQLIFSFLEAKSDACCIMQAAVGCDNVQDPLVFHFKILSAASLHR